ncbi:MAG: hypothetical protein LQ347_000535 [Umbilicaria vellea]|nr:MAG: hypothetical protein LQ347_000535 [Umbilicaria vellea]
MAASSVLELHRSIAKVSILALEQTKYGSVARGIKAQTEHLAIVAESMDTKLQVMNLEALSEAYTPEVRTALARYKRHLDDASLRLKQTEYEAERQLREYESSGKGMEEIAEKYGELRKKMDSVMVDVKRLGPEN